MGLMLGKIRMIAARITPILVANLHEMLFN
jgi:hypothetical protein